ncbi:metal-dependent hydrolase [Parasphingorhabdus sp.]|uniref:metal-dependent hydrolase n=1 Tax=Parasphingorhabdus sp. TaxID=2709688 RepID=UPI003266C97A
MLQESSKATELGHPMDDIPIRPLDFQSEELDEKAVLWSQSSPHAAIFLNAFSAHVPYFEKYLVRTMTKALKVIKDEGLAKDVEAIIGQEAHHARNFIEFNKIMARRYPKVGEMELRNKQDFFQWAKEQELKELVGFTAGYETFTFLAGMIVLASYEEWMADSDPTMKAMWVWHQVEEVEHGAVAFEVYKYLYADHEWYRKYMIAKALLHIATEVLKAYLAMCKAEGYFKRPGSAVKALSFITVSFSKMVWYCLPTFSKKYHPRHHPLATTKQNKVAVAWRRFTKAGGDPLKIDREKMEKIVGFS